MNISLNWLKQYIDTDLDPVKVGEILTDIGLEVEGMEEVLSVPGGLEGLVIGEVKTRDQHPNADRLSVTTVDVGADDLLHIVCGAPNVAAGRKVVVATINTKLYPTEGDPFVIKKGKIRGEVSEGMICAEDEIGLGTEHDGIIVLPDDAQVGMAAADYYGIEKDYVYEIGLTPNRSDATSHLGVARDLAAALKINYEGTGVVKIPAVDNFPQGIDAHPVKVSVENTEACPRYAGLVIKNLKIGPSPDWMKQRLQAIGVRPISNVVDITNYVLHEYGQPLHAFDLEKIKGQEVIVKTLPEKTKFLSLDEVERELSAEDLMICNGESEGMCIGGVFGGLSSGVTDDTTAIFLESARFNPGWIRRTSMRHNLRTDAAKVFEKGSDPAVVIPALKRAASLLIELAGGEVASGITDIYPEPIEPKQVTVDYEYVQRLIGIAIPPVEIRGILEAMDMEILSTTEETFTVAVPTNKFDVVRPADIVEEVLRIYGLNKIPLPAQIRTSVSIAPHPDPRKVRDKVGDVLTGLGYSEIMAVSLTESRYFKELMPIEDSSLVYINNTSNVQLDVMRPTMLFSGLEAIVHNQNRQNADLRLFEFGRSYLTVEDGHQETKHLSLFATGSTATESWLQTKQPTADYYALKGVVDQLMGRLGFQGYQESESEHVGLSYGRKYHRGPQVLVEFGMVQGSITKQMGIKKAVFFAEFNWNNILKALKKAKVAFQEISKFPTMRRDLALVVDNHVKFSDIAGIARKTGKKLLKEVNLFDVYTNEKQLGANKKSYAISLIFENPEKTLKDKEVDKIMQKLIMEYEGKVNALIRK